MSVLFIHYPKCSTCQKAAQWLRDHHIEFTERHIVEQNPKAEELQQWIQQSGREVKAFFNTSGLAYKALCLKDRLPGLNTTEQISLLASDGMLVKRPICISDQGILVGFKPKEWEAVHATG